MDQAAVAGLPLGWLVPLVAVLGALSLALLALRSPALSRSVARSAALLASAVILLGCFLTYSIELLPGRWPNVARVVLYVLVHLVVIAAILRPRAAAVLLDRRVFVGASLFPGVLLITPTRITQVEAYVAAVLIGAFVLIVGVPRADDDAAPSLRGAIREVTRALGPSERVRRWLRAVAALALLALVFPVGIREAEFLPRALVTSAPALLTLAMVSIAVIALDRGLRARKAGEARAASDAALGALVIVISLLLRRSAPAGVCLAAWLTLPAVSLFAYVAHRRRALAELFMLAAYAWVSRDAELPILAATILIAGLVGDAFGESLAGRPARPSAVLFVVTFLFAWTFVQRVGIELGLDFIHFDWGAGAFRELGAPMERIGAALAFKHGVARGAVILIVLSALPNAHRAWAALGLLAAELMRTAALMAMLYLCRASFWTCLRIIGDMPHSLTAIVVAAIAVLGVALTEASAARRAPITEEIA